MVAIFGKSVSINRRHEDMNQCAILYENIHKQQREYEETK